jgi:hypothetical protein
MISFEEEVGSQNFEMCLEPAPHDLQIRIPKNKIRRPSRLFFGPIEPQPTVSQKSPNPCLRTWHCYPSHRHSCDLYPLDLDLKFIKFRFPAILKPCAACSLGDTKLTPTDFVADIGRLHSRHSSPCSQTCKFPISICPHLCSYWMSEMPLTVAFLAVRERSLLHLGAPTL